MATLAELKVIIGANTSDFNKKMSKVQATLGKAGAKMKSVGKTMSIGITAPLGLLAFGALKSASSLETLEVAFDSMLGSGEAASKMVKDLTDFTAKTPFQLEGVGKAAKQLLSFGVAGDEILGKLKFLGDIASGANVPLSDMASIFGKVKAKGKAMTEELLQLSDRGVPIIDVLAKKMGVAKDAIFDMASKGKISFEVMQDAMQSMTTEGGIFEDQMKKQSNTMAGIWSTLKDNVELALGALGEDIMKAFDLKNVLKDAIGFIQEMTEKFKALSPATKKMIVILGGVAAVAGPLVFILGSMATAIAAISAPVLIVVGAFAALAIGIGAFNAINSDATDGLRLTRIELNAELNVLKKGNITQKQRTKLIGDINTKYKDYLPNLITEKSSLEDIQKAQNAANLALKERISLVAKQEIMAEAERELVEAQKAVFDSQLKMEKIIVKNRGNFSDFNQEAIETSIILGNQRKALIEATEKYDDLLNALGPVTKEAEDTGDAIEEVVTTEIVDKVKDLTEGLTLLQSQMQSTRDEVGKTLDPKGIEDPTGGPPAVIKETGDAVAEVETRVATMFDGIKVAAAGFVDFMQDNIPGAIAAVGEAIGEALVGGDPQASFKEFVKGMLQNLKVLGEVLIATGLPLLLTPLTAANGLGQILAGTGLIAAATAGMALFAEGGLVSGPVMGMVGEGRGTSKSNPEVIAPLNKLKGMLAGGGGSGMRTIRLVAEGSDLVATITEHDIRALYHTPTGNLGA